MNVLKIAMLPPLVWPQLLVGLLLHVIPDLTRSGLFFGVTVDPRFRESSGARAIRRRYGMAVWLATLVAIAFGVIAASAVTGANRVPATLVAVVTHRGLPYVPWILQFAVALWAYVRANRVTRPNAVRPASVVQVELPSRSEPTSAIVAVLALPLASLGLLAAWIAAHWRNIPDRLAVHWSISGPDRWVSTTPASVTALLSLHGVVCSLLALLAWGLLQGSRHVATYGEAAQREQRFRGRTLTLVVIAEYFSVFPAWAVLLAVPASAMRIWAIAFAAAILVIAGILVVSGQGGSRGLTRSGGAPVGDRTDDRYWTWGLIYFNRADPAFLVEKRFGIGYTFNFGHPFAWALLALIAAIPLIGRLI